MSVHIKTDTRETLIGERKQVRDGSAGIWMAGN